MTAFNLFKKTMPFNMAKLGLGAATVGISVVLFAILMLIGSLFGEGGVCIGFIIWAIATLYIKFLMVTYFGYLVKAGHVAVITQAVTTGQVPDNQLEYGKNMVKSRFVTSNAYFAIDKLISGSVKQIQRGIGKVGDMMSFIPGMDQLTKIVNLFVKISLNYVDECCLGYTFLHKEQGAFKSACDGVVIYAENWKVLLKNAAFTMLKVIVATIVVGLIIFIPIGALFTLLEWNKVIALIIAFMLAYVVKYAFLDSFIMCEMMTAYMQVAPSTQISFDLYGKLCKISRKFKELFEKGQAEGQTSVA